MYSGNHLYWHLRKQSISVIIIVNHYKKIIKKKNSIIYLYEHIIIQIYHTFITKSVLKYVQQNKIRNATL